MPSFDTYRELYILFASLSATSKYIVALSTVCDISVQRLIREEHLNDGDNVRVKSQGTLGNLGKLVLPLLLGLRTAGAERGEVVEHVEAAPQESFNDDDGAG